jgi:hypothetical protein
MDASRGRWKLVLPGTVAVLIVAVAAVGVAQASHVPVTTSCSSTGVLADGTTVNTVNINVEPTKLRTKQAVEVVHICNVGASGFTSGWHHHNGPIIVNVTATGGGSLTFYSPDNCTGTIVGPGQAYIESTGDPILARNESGTTATWITTQIIPVGAALIVPESTTFCGLS